MEARPQEGGFQVTSSLNSLSPVLLVCPVFSNRVYLQVLRGNQAIVLGVMLPNHSKEDFSCLVLGFC